jgi:hypothetical protein
MSRDDPYSREELLKLIEASGEDDNVDAKAPMLWDEREASAALSKDFAAFANSRDGGAIVIGKSERDGGFDYVGVTAEQAKSFDTTRVANFVNSRFNPPINLTCHSVERDGKQFIVIVVSEFRDIPALCIKNVEQKPKGHILRSGALYVRTANAESAQLGMPDQLRELIGMATSKRADEMLTTFHAMLQGRPLVAPPDDRELFEKHFAAVRESVEAPVLDKMAKGGWSMTFHPSRFDVRRFSDIDELEAIISNRAVRLRQEFPPSRRETTAFNWGIGNSLYGESWGFSRAGLFLLLDPFNENTYDYQSPWRKLGDLQPSATFPAGKWLDFQPQLFKIIEFFTFMSRMVPLYDPAESISFRLVAGPLSGRRLVTTNPAINLDPDFAEVAREHLFVWDRTIPIQDFQATWRDECAAALKRFFELFPGHRTTVETLRSWVERFQSRDFGR